MAVGRGASGTKSQVEDTFLEIESNVSQKNATPV